LSLIVVGEVWAIKNLSLIADWMNWLLEIWLNDKRSPQANWAYISCLDLQWLYVVIKFWLSFFLLGAGLGDSAGFSYMIWCLALRWYHRDFVDELAVVFCTFSRSIYKPHNHRFPQSADKQDLYG
jgi:hypothetical protein